MSQKTEGQTMERTKNVLSVAPRGEREILMSRTFKAPQALVWEALSKPEHIQRWWGGGCGEMTSCELDFRVGGKYRFVTVSPEGENGFRGEYREITPVERIVQTFEWEGLPGHISLETLTLSELNKHTTMSIVCLFDSTDDRDGMLHSGMEEGAGQSYNRLQELLDELA